MKFIDNIQNLNDKFNTNYNVLIYIITIYIYYYFINIFLCYFQDMPKSRKVQSKQQLLRRYAASWCKEWCTEMPA